MNSDLQTFDGLDNRRELMILLDRLGSDRARRAFLLGLVPLSLKGFAGIPARLEGPCNAVTAYNMLIGLCNEVGVPINEAAKRLDERVRRMK